MGACQNKEEGMGDEGRCSASLRKRALELEQHGIDITLQTPIPGCEERNIRVLPSDEVQAQCEQFVRQAARDHAGGFEESDQVHVTFGSIAVPHGSTFDDIGTESGAVVFARLEPDEVIADILADIKAAGMDLHLNEPVLSPQRGFDASTGTIKLTDLNTMTRPFGEE